MCDSKIRFICADPITNKCIPDRGNTSIVMGAGQGSVHGSYVSEETCKASWQCRMGRWDTPQKDIKTLDKMPLLSPPMPGPPAISNVPVPIPTMMPKFYAQQ